MNDQFRLFHNRVSRIDKAYANRIPNAFKVGSDGLVTPKTRSRLRFRFPFRAVFAGFVAVIAVKTFLIWYLGEPLFAARMETLLAGARYEQMAAQVLMPDALSIWLSQRLDFLVTALR